jgi:ComF family protein
MEIGKSIAGRLLDLIVPPICPCCETIKLDETPFCPDCVPKLFSEGAYCKRCGGRRYEVIESLGRCVRCQQSEFVFERAVILGEYQNEMRRLILKMKTDTFGNIAMEFAKLLIQVRGEELRSEQVQLVLPIPMHWKRRRKRKVNAPEIIAEKIASFLKIPAALHWVKQTRATEIQHYLSAAERAENVENAYRLNQPLRFLFPRPFSKIQGKKVLLVDDVLTTGSTCNAVSRILLQAGAKSVTVCAVARAEGGYQEGGEKVRG